ncbi:MAG: hypothetical protein ACXWZM_10785 [Solirubrobacterales bacterium]
MLRPGYHARFAPPIRGAICVADPAAHLMNTMISINDTRAAA